jgi:hypothetical protein
MTAATADRLVDKFVDEELRTFPVASGETIYQGAWVGLSVTGYAKAFVPGDLLVGYADEQKSIASTGSDGDEDVTVHVMGTVKHTLTGVAVTDIGRAVYASDDNTLAFIGHPDAFVGRVIAYLASNTAAIQLKKPGEKPLPSDKGSYEIVADFAKHFVGTGSTSTSVLLEGGMVGKGILGTGVNPASGEDGGCNLAFDAVAEVALASIRTQDVFAVDKGITFEARLHLSDHGDDAAVDFDWGLGTLLTTNSEASIDHGDMVDLACFHLDGNADKIYAQSDDNTTDVSATDTTVENDETAGAFQDFKLIIRTDGSAEFYIDGARVLSSTTFAVRSTVNLAAFLNLEKTSNDTTAVVVIDRIRIAGSRGS